MLGTRGVPARYGGFETAVEEVGRRLADKGHEVVVYCRGSEGPPEHLGMSLVHLPAVERRSLETITHTFRSARHIRRGRRFDAVLLFNAANAFALPLLRGVAPGIALHVDGLEWQRDKWSAAGKAWYLVMERFGARQANQLIADARGIEEYYARRYSARSVFIPYGAQLVEREKPRFLEARGLTSRGYDLVVARLEPENHTDIAIEGHLQTDRAVPLVVVGSVPYESDYSRRLEALAASSASIRMLGGVWDHQELDELYAHCRLYIHGHSVGGTNPALLRAMGAAAATAAFDVVFNREVLGETGRFFRSSSELAALIATAEESQEEWLELGEKARARVVAMYDWDDVAHRYEQLCLALASRR
jgi:glycosyltransferase involved in cell wall biosynthesis